MMKWQLPNGQEIKEFNSELLINYTQGNWEEKDPTGG